LSKTQQKQYAESSTGGDADVIACAEEKGVACVNLVMIRNGRHLGDKSFFPQNAQGGTTAEVLQAFLAQHYAGRQAPANIVAGVELDADGIEALPAGPGGQKVHFVSRPQGERRAWLEMAQKNAQLALAQRLSQTSNQEARLAALREALGLPDTVQRIECFDISHTMGEATVASCVVYEGHGMQKADYRRFNIRGITPGDDYAAMRQVLARRYERITTEGGKMPDLILIDGGKGQVTQARSVLEELGLHDVSVIGVAKGPERKAGLEELIVAADNSVITLPPQHPGLHLIQQIRDEAHRFAIVGHRARRGKSRTTSELNEIPGIGGKRRRALLAHFGGLKGVEAAAMDEIMKVEGISRAIAERIYRHLHGEAEAKK